MSNRSIFRLAPFIIQRAVSFVEPYFVAYSNPVFFELSSSNVEMLQPKLNASSDNDEYFNAPERNSLLFTESDDIIIVLSRV